MRLSVLVSGIPAQSCLPATNLCLSWECLVVPVLCGIQLRGRIWKEINLLEKVVHIKLRGGWDVGELTLIKSTFLSLPTYIMS